MNHLDILLILVNNRHVIVFLAGLNANVCGAISRQLALKLEGIPTIFSRYLQYVGVEELLVLDDPKSEYSFQFGWSEDSIVWNEPHVGTVS